MTRQGLGVTRLPGNKTLVQARPPHRLLGSIWSLLLCLPSLKLRKAETCYSYPERQADHAPDQL